jgi:hypothetical protein
MGFTGDRTEQRSLRRLDDEMAGRAKNFHKRYLYQSTYEPHLRRWIEAFGRSWAIINASSSSATRGRWSRTCSGSWGWPTSREHPRERRRTDTNEPRRGRDSDTSRHTNEALRDSAGRTI